MLRARQVRPFDTPPRIAIERSERAASL